MDNKKEGRPKEGFYAKNASQNMVFVRLGPNNVTNHIVASKLAAEIGLLAGLKNIVYVR